MVDTYLNVLLENKKQDAFGIFTFKKLGKKPQPNYFSCKLVGRSTGNAQCFII